jgi:HEAT repeat protein
VKLLEEEGTLTVSRFEEAVNWGQRVPELEAIVAEVALRMEQGRLDLSRDPNRIREAIAMLDGTQRQQLIATERLIEAGEYAVPHVLREMIEGQDERVRFACEKVLRSIGRLAVTPLCTAIFHVDDQRQSTLCEILGDIGYPHAAPSLRELSMKADVSTPVHEAAMAAFRKCGGIDVDLSTQFSNLGRQYFDGVSSLIAYPTEATNNIWSYDAFAGLENTPVPTSIFGEVMAMRNATKALSLDNSNSVALSLFVAANLKRENDLAPETSDPIYGEMTYTPSFYATVFGTRTCLAVLGMAIDRLDTPLVRDAIAALAQTTGGSNLFATGSGRQPLLEALSYPDRRVQYEAALALGRALPQNRFVGDAQVVPVLASAVRSSGRQFAIVVAENDEDRRQIGTHLQGAGFDVVGAEASVASLANAIAEATGIDLVVVQQTTAESSSSVVKELRSSPKTIAAPILVAAPSDGRGDLEREYFDNQRVLVVPVGQSAEAMGASIDELFTTAVGGRMDEAQAEIYAIESLDVLSRIAINRSPTYRINDAEPALLAALAERTGGLRLLVADILSMIDSERSQRALFDAAFAAEGSDRIELLEDAAASVRNFGNLAESQQVNQLVELIATSTGDEAEAAARLHGALNVETAAAVKLIPEGK